MSKITVELDIKELIEHMPLKKRLTLVRELEKTTWAQRLDNIVDRIRHQIKRIPTETEITRICKRARKKVYEKYKSGH